MLEDPLSKTHNESADQEKLHPEKQEHEISPAAEAEVENIQEGLKQTKLELVMERIVRNTRKKQKTVKDPIEIPDNADAEKLSASQKKELAAAVKIQIDNAIKLDSPEAYELFRTFGVAGSVQQREAALLGLQGVKAEEYLQLVGQVMEQARGEGKNIDTSEWPRIVRHELQHKNKAVEVGFDQAQMEMAVGFYEETNGEGATTIGYGVDFHVGDHWGHPVEKAEVTLAPDDPSNKDLMVFFMNFQANRKTFWAQPARTIPLLRKFQKFAQITPIQFAKILFSKEK